MLLNIFAFYFFYFLVRVSKQHVQANTWECAIVRANSRVKLRALSTLLGGQDEVQYIIYGIQRVSPLVQGPV